MPIVNTILGTYVGTVPLRRQLQHKHFVLVQQPYSHLQKQESFKQTEQIFSWQEWMP